MTNGLTPTRQGAVRGFAFAYERMAPGSREWLPVTALDVRLALGWSGVALVRAGRVMSSTRGWVYRRSDKPPRKMAIMF